MRYLVAIYKRFFISLWRYEILGDIQMVGVCITPLIPIAMMMGGSTSNLVVIREGGRLGVC